MEALSCLFKGSLTFGFSLGLRESGYRGLSSPFSDNAFFLFWCKCGSASTFKMGTCMFGIDIGLEVDPEQSKFVPLGEVAILMRLMLYVVGWGILHTGSLGSAVQI